MINAIQSGLPALAAALCLCTALSATAGTISKTVPAGRASKVDHYTGWNDDCSFLSVNVDILVKPAHGTLAPRTAMGRIGEAQIGNAGACRGKPTKVLELYYKPARGYRGTDGFSVNMRTPKSAPVRYDYVVTVE